ncbi:hypothetical protein [Wohlfahrtiimonas larvae]|uniref:Uracil-DNA glycosylase-like domain-containing protein n=1 Tax=Wohlfahrtiimonas larvae TaxID=1157986 RepID=A0ABP9MT81_9GAMM|nr:hypothetical protein [Wohlfahrtiimonas larvae]
MNKEQVLKFLSNKNYGQYASWALYDVSDEQINNGKIEKKDVGFEPFKNNFKEKINFNGIFLALNCAARDIQVDDWSIFHDIRSMSQDYKIPYMIKNTKYEGSYMTDLFKGIHMTESDKFNEAIKKPENQSIYASSIASFQEEYDLIKPEAIICFGGDVEKYLKRMIKKGELKVDKEVNIIRLTHYAHYMSIDGFKEQRNKLL